MATKNDTSDNPTQDFLKGLLRRAGGQHMDIQDQEVEEAGNDSIGEVEVVRVEQNPDSEDTEATLLRLQKKGGK